MNSNHLCNARNQKPLPVRMPRMPIDEKLAYVESVCDVLNESRFGFGNLYSIFDQQDDHAADEPTRSPGLIDDEYLPWYATAYQGNDPQRETRRCVALTDAFRARKFTTLASDAMGSWLTDRDRFPTTLGRGSPKLIDARTPFASSFAALASSA